MLQNTAVKLKSIIWFWIHNHRRNVIVSRFARLCKNLHRASEHPGHDIEVNGEKDILTRSINLKAPMIFDVGANVGEWSACAKTVFPESTVHAFELNPVTASKLAERFFSTERVFVHSFGLSDASGEVNFFAYSGEASVLSGMRAPLFSHVPHTVEVSTVRTGDQFCRDNNIALVNFLKIDAEGADLDVLHGFANMLTKQAIDLIQFEHQGGRYLRDFYDFLLPKGYIIGKLYANYVDFREHEAEMEDLLGPNYIAIPGTRTKEIAFLTGGW